MRRTVLLIATLFAGIPAVLADSASARESAAGVQRRPTTVVEHRQGKDRVAHPAAEGRPAQAVPHVLLPSCGLG